MGSGFTSLLTVLWSQVSIGSKAQTKLSFLISNDKSSAQRGCLFPSGHTIRLLDFKPGVPSWVGKGARS